MMRQYILYGTGAKAEYLWNFINEIEENILFCVDSNSQKWNTYFKEKIICSIQEIYKYPNAYICIAAVDEKEEMKNNLIRIGIEKHRIINYNEMIIQVLKEYDICHKNKHNKSERRESIIIDCSKGLNLGGLEEWSKSLTIELYKRKYEAFILGPSGEKTNSSILDKRILPIEYVKEKYISKHSVLQMIEIFEKQLPCTIITGSINPYFIAACIVKRKNPDKVKIISVIHQGINAVYKEYKDMFEYIDFIVAVSMDILEGMIEKDWYSEKIRHITCPVQCENELIRKYSKKNEPIRLGYGGRIVVPQKRMDLILKLCKELERNNVNYVFEIAGDGDYVEEIKKFIFLENLQEKIILIGKKERKDMSDFWKRQDICINIADHEGRSLSVMEAMANGAIPIVTETSGINEDISNDYNGFIVDIGDYKSMAEKIMYLENHRELLKDMGQEAHKVISQKSDMSEHISVWEKILAENTM